MYDCLLVVDRDGTLIEECNYLGKNVNWKSEVKIKKETINLIKKIEKRYPNIIKIVFTNQTGVALGFFDEKKVKEINTYISKILEEYQVTIHHWIYSPEADSDYASHKNLLPNKYIKANSSRKPNPKLLLNKLHEQELTLHSFKKIYVIGDSQDDEQLAEHIGAQFILV